MLLKQRREGGRVAVDHGRDRPLEAGGIRAGFARGGHGGSARRELCDAVIGQQEVVAHHADLHIAERQRCVETEVDPP